MPKKKIKDSVGKRFKITKTGKVMFGHQANSHLKTSKSKKTIRRHNVPAELPQMFAKKVKKLMGAL